ncbi:MAG: 4Fe-4S ferredoxin [Deltaproteobacteria bacterium]|nr:MAG: 4Fe-4S ferredoxin [Deltaproteobacteria bacterium]
MKRPIIKIDEDKCTGCGLCIVNCAESSLEIRDGKAVLVREALCDGLGACIGHCPEGALTLEERDVEAFDEELVEERIKEQAAVTPQGGGCPGSAAKIIERPAMGGCPGSLNVSLDKGVKAADGGPATSRLGHWPVQLTLLNPAAPFLKGANLLFAADCAPFAFGDFHREFLDGNPVAVACPKLDDADAHMKKLADVIRYGEPASLTIVRMEVPCCGGLEMIVRRAAEESGVDIPVKTVVISTGGEIVHDER